MEAKSIKGNSPEEIKTALQQSMADGFAPTLAIVFMSIKQDRKAICDLLDKEDLEVFGLTTAGEFIDDDIGKESTAIMLLNVNRSHFKILLKETKESNTKDISRSVAEEGLKTFSNPAFIVACDGFSTDAETIIQGIEEIVGDRADIFGGMAGDDLTATGTFVFTKKRVTGDGLIALIINKDKVQITGLATHGWQPVGTVRTVTKCEGNIVYTIDEEPALNILMKYMGASFDPATSQEMKYNFGEYYPVQLLRDNAPSVMREIRAINTKDYSILFTAPVHQGLKFRFSLPPDFDIIDKISEDCHKVKSEQQPEADAVIVFSCVTRPMSFGPMINKEVEEINKVWKSPMIGFFSYGEIGKSLAGKNELHNNTCMIVVLKEK